MLITKDSSIEQVAYSLMFEYVAQFTFSEMSHYPYLQSFGQFDTINRELLMGE